MTLEAAGFGVVATARPSCTSTQCPTQASSAAALNLTNVPEGARSFRQVTEDMAGNVSTSSTWTSFVDKSPPSSLTDVRSLKDADSGDGFVTWDDSGDPMLADGSPGAGIDHYAYRYRVAAGTMSAWQSTEESWFAVPGTVVGTPVYIEIYPVDGVDNPGTTSSVTATTQSDSNGMNADDAPMTAADETPYTTARCEAYYGPGSAYCAEPQDDPQPSTAPSDSRTALSATPRDLIYGISDEDAGTAKPAPNDTRTYLDNPLFQDLKVRRTRRILAWDIMRYPERVKAFRRYYERAKDLYPAVPGDQRVDIMVSFQLPCNKDGVPGDAANPPAGACYRDEDLNRNGVPDSGDEIAPKLQDYAAAVYDFKLAFPMVRTMSAWNEPNDERQPTSSKAPRGRPARAARYTYALERYVCARVRRSGRSCTVIAADLAQSPMRSEKSYLSGYIRSLKARFASAGNPSDLRYPQNWAVHPYTDIDLERTKQSTTNTHFFAKMVGIDKRIWFTEAGSRLRGGKTESDQAQEVEYLVDKLAVSLDRIDRLYYYSLCTDSSNGFDSGLLKPAPARPTTGSPFCGDTPRPAYATYKTRTLRNPNG